MLVVMFAWLAVEPWIIQPLVLNELALSGVDPQQVNAFKFLEIRNIAEGAYSGPFRSLILF
jgi:hypothetical protein